MKPLRTLRGPTLFTYRMNTGTMSGYNQHTSDHCEPGTESSVEEEFVREALAEYTEVSNYRIWCTVEDLYQVYRGAWLVRGLPYPGEDDPRLMNRQQFGAALNAVFPNTVAVTRRANKLKKRGRACLTGPVAREIKRGGRPPRRPE